MGLFLTRTLMYPGAFTIRGLLEGIARAEPLKQVHRRGAAAYAKAQKRPLPAMLRAFTYDRSRRFERAYGSCER